MKRAAVAASITAAMALMTLPVGVAVATTPASTLTCGQGSAHLVVSWRGGTGGLAGSGGDLFWVRNVGSANCALRGYPVVNFVGRDHRVVLVSGGEPGHLGNDQFGIARGARPPAVRLAAHGGLASFWVFGQGVSPPCPVAYEMVVTLTGVRGRATVLSPHAYSSWPYCGRAVVVNPLVPGASGSLPPKPLRDEIMFGP
jgi:hypothetical protein